MCNSGGPVKHCLMYHAFNLCKYDRQTKVGGEGVKKISLGYRDNNKHEIFIQSNALLSIFFRPKIVFPGVGCVETHDGHTV